MKRSEMILRLMESMVEAPEDIEKAAEYLLKRIEKAGMVPPSKCGHRVCLIETCGNAWEKEQQ